MNRVAMANRHCRPSFMFFVACLYGGEQQQTFDVLVVGHPPPRVFEDQ